MIYFDKPTQLAILKKFVPLLRNDGLLYAGHSESFHHAEEYFKLRGKTVYELSTQARKISIEIERTNQGKNSR
jgi:chemotaxis protein methyltransferase CheR